MLGQFRLRRIWCHHRPGAYSEGAMAPPPIVDWVDFFYGKAGFVGTVLSTRSVLWTSNIPKIRWRPGLRPGPHWGAHDAPSDPLVGWGGGHPLPNPHPVGAFGAQLRCPNVKSWLRPCHRLHLARCSRPTIALSYRPRSQSLRVWSTDWFSRLSWLNRCQSTD